LLKEDARFFTFTAGKDDAVNVSELGLPKDARVIFFYRDNQFHFADDDTKLRKGDEVIILTHSKNIPDFNERWYPKEDANKKSE